MFIFAGNVLAVEEEQAVQHVENNLQTATLLSYLNSSSTHIIKETLWLISNLIADNKNSAVKILENDILQTIVKYITYGNNICVEVGLIEASQPISQVASVRFQRKKDSHISGEMVIAPKAKEICLQLWG